MTKTYVIADLHGRFDLLGKALETIYSRGGINDTIVTLGDYVDRGPDSFRIISELIDIQSAANGHLICLKGNHEEMMLETIRKPLDPGWWLSNGGNMTLISYGAKVGDTADGSIVPAAHLDWIDKLPLMHVDEHRVYVHAGVNPAIPLEGQYGCRAYHGGNLLTWKIYNDDDEGGHGMRHVVHGHHQFANGPILKKGRTDLDTYAWKTGRLVVGVFDDDTPGGPVDLIEIKGEPA
jgi:serine/threonine protein phosphatase 1